MVDDALKTLGMALASEPTLPLPLPWLLPSPIPPPQLYGGLSGANAIDFMLAGRDWRWGPDYRLDRLAATGSADSGEGVALEELAVDAGGRGWDAEMLAGDRPVVQMRSCFTKTPYTHSNRLPSRCPRQALPACACRARCCARGRTHG